jgi:hypothetical protein
MDADGPSGIEKGVSPISITKLYLGFRNAPVTKCLVPVIGGCSALAIALHSKPHMALPQLVDQHQVSLQKRKQDLALDSFLCMFSSGDYLQIIGHLVALEVQLWELGLFTV